MDMTFARVGFDATIDEIVEVHLRQFGVFPELRRRRQRARFWFGVAVAFFILAGSSALWMAGRGIVEFLVCLAAAATGGWLSARAYDRSIERKVYRHVAQQRRGSPALRCDVELRSSGLWIDYDQVERLHKWPDVTAVNDMSGGVEIVMRATILMVRNRAFANSAEREAFVGQARRLASTVDAATI